MDVRAELIAPCPPEALFAWVDDLARYPAWMGLVHRADPEEASGAAGPSAWSVELRGRVGPLARSKRLRMVRTLVEPPSFVRFERQEIDGRRHSSWVLDVRVAPLAPDPSPDLSARHSRLEMALRYEGRWWSSLLERVLLEQIESARDRLLTLVTAEA